MDGKKISFGFFKTKKAEKPVVEEKKEYIECLEEKSIKVVGGEVEQVNTPLVIPMKPNTLITAERLRQIAEEVEKAVELEPEPGEAKIKEEDCKVPENETLEQMAARELLNEAKKEVVVDAPSLTVPLPSKPVMEGEKESTMEDYESVPIQDFGMAMLRGMGWTPGKESKYKQPQLRPKGLGLGADKVVKENQKKNHSKNKDEDLSIIKNAYVKIITGKYSGCYGKVVSLDEDNGRVMVDIAVKKETVSLSEFMMQPVTKSEFDKQSRVINADSYEEYKKNEKSAKNESPKQREASTSKRPKEDRSYNERRDDVDRRDRDITDRRDRDRDITDHRDRDNGDRRYNEESRRERKDDRRNDYENSSNGRSKDKHRSRKDSSSSEDRSRRRNKRYSSNDSIQSVSDTEKRKKDRKRYSSSESDSDSYKKYKRDKKKKEEGKRDIDKKRKGKKKKRDRDRSPNYKKHRK